MAELLNNPLAPPALTGFNADTPEGYVDVDFSYPYDVVLAGNQTLTGQQISTTNDADFAWRAVISAVATGTFNIKFYDSQNYALSNDYIASANLVGDASSPFPIFPEILIPAGGRIGIDIADTSGNPNTIEILCRGIKRFRVA
jgi:hypothetical protein